MISPIRSADVARAPIDCAELPTWSAIRCMPLIVCVTMSPPRVALSAAFFDVSVAEPAFFEA